MGEVPPLGDFEICLVFTDYLLPIASPHLILKKKFRGATTSWCILLTTENGREQSWESQGRISLKVTNPVFDPQDLSVY